MTASEPARTRRNVGSTLADFLLGPPFARRFALAHVVDDLGDAIVNLSLVNSLFLSVSLDASRQRILLYLVLTAAPLVFIAPLIGSVLDRTRFGYRIAISGSQALRAVVAVALIGSLLSIALYPLTFVLLVARKAYGLAKSALLSQMTTDPQELLSSDTHIGRTGTMAAGVGTALGGLLLIGGYTTAMLLIAAVAFLVAAVISSGLPHPNQAVRLKSVPRLSEAIPAGILSATIAATAVRAAAGALTYLLAFAIKRGGGDAWIFTAGLFAAGAGGLIANLTVTRLHRRLDCDWVLVLSLMVPGLVCALGVATVGQFGVLAIAFSIGLGRSVATRALAVLNASVPLLARARSVARTELVFQVATLVGAILAVQLAPTPSTGFAVSSLALLAAGTAFGFRHRNSLRQQARRALLGEDAPTIDRSLPDALLNEARRLATLGAYRMAVVVTGSAIDIVVEREPALREHASYRQWIELGSRIAHVRSDDEQPPESLVLDALRLADELIHDARPVTAGPVAFRSAYL